ncbi:UPF0764 protein C16orf89 homolog [Diachasma alloeum]|uniref:UPF0764 protein C16orf89 homolog n=1 Tax=Diachasma alloeum TaxID=454923 RepID=UPI0007384F02|nr:UPF0764 protein C16orf89 homolog [Diachasma alloeum]
MNVQDQFWLLLFFILSGQCWIKGINSSQCNHSTFGKLLHGLHKDVEFMHTRRNQLNVDSAFGLALAEANLGMILTSENWKYLNDEDFNLVFEIRELAAESRKYVQENLRTEKDRIFSKVLTNVDLWIRPISWKHVSSLPMTSPNPNLSDLTINDVIHAGAPKENESDYCLLLLINQSLSGKSCQLSNECIEMMMKEDGSRGYAMTHRLLIIQVANALTCDQHPSMDSKPLIEEFCRNIYQDLLDLEASGFPGVGVDLAIEQIFLCGMEGYSEFVTSHYKNLLLGLPNFLGCYSARGYPRYYRTKRSSNPMDYGCDNHTSGVAAAALSLLLRECIESSEFYIDENSDTRFMEYS